MIKRNTCLTVMDYIKTQSKFACDLEPSLNVSYTGYSRFAMRNVFKLLGFDSTTRILLPAYICNVILLPMAELGIEPVYYGITDDFQVDFNTLTLSNNVKAIITVNYCGSSLDYGVIKDYAQRNGLVWINDNAHGFASSLGNKKLEQFGDFSITSFRKIIPSLNGSRTVINNGLYDGLKGELDRLNATLHREPRVKFLAGNFLRSFGIYLRKLPDYSDMFAFEERDLKAYGIDDLSLHLLQMSNEDRIRERRRQLYSSIENFLMDSDYDFVQPVAGLFKAGNSPMAFPVIVQEQGLWRKILEASRSVGIDIHTWPSLPQSVIENNHFYSVDVWKRYLFLPIHQDLNCDSYLIVLKKVFDMVAGRPLSHCRN